MTDEQPPIAPPPSPFDPPPPPGHGPFAFPPPPDQPQHYGAPRGYYPLDFNAVMRNTASIFRFAWPTLLTVALIPNLVVYAFLVPLTAMVSPGFNRWLDAYQEALPTGEIPGLPEELKVPLLLMLLLAFVSVLVSVIVSAAIVEIGDSVFRGRPVSVQRALGFALGRAPSVIGAQLLLVLAAFGVLLLGLVFGILLMSAGSWAIFLGLIVIVGAFAALIFLEVRWSLVVQAVVLEKMGAVDGLSRSWRLVAGSGWRVLGYIIFIGILTGVFAAILGAVPQAILRLDGATSTGAAVGTVLDGLAATLLAPITPLVMLFLYYDLRYRANEPAPQPGEDRQLA